MTWSKAEKEHMIPNHRSGLVGSVNAALRGTVPGLSSLAAPKRVRVATADRQQQIMEDDNPNVQHQAATAARFRIQGESPEKRAGHTATLVGNRRLMIVGGSFQTEYLKTVYELDIDPPPDLTLNTLPPSVTLVRGLAQFYNCEEFSDIVFLVEDEPVYCHRIVLSTQSEWFRVLFSRGFKESNEKEIPLNNVSLKVFKQMIEFFYLGGIPLLAPNQAGGMAIESGDESNMHMNVMTSSLDAPSAKGADEVVENSQDSEVLQGSSRRHGGDYTVDSSSSPQVADEEPALTAVCDLLVLADQFMCEHLKERCEITLARMLNDRTVKHLLMFARANRTDLLLRCCEHFEKWGSSSASLM
jgi:hypothetical protein